MEQTLSSYYIFYVVADCGNISKAAAKLYISQPAVSKSIQKLEGSLGCRLFLRGSRGVVLTEEGSVLYAHVKSAIDTLSRGEEKIRRSIDLGTGHLKIGVSSTLCKYVLLPYLKDFIKEHPHMNISIKCQSTSKTLQLIQEDKLDIGLIGLGNQELMHMLQFDYILDIEDLFVATKQYLYHLQLRGVSEHEILQNCSLMLLEKNNITRQYIDEYLQKNKIVIRECIDASSMDLLIEFAKMGIGISCVVKQFVEQELETGCLMEIPLSNPVPSREIGFLYQDIEPLNENILKFIHAF